MLTIFTHTKAFKGHVGVIQRNAISQWVRLRPRPEILLFGIEEGAPEIAREFGLRHIPDVERSPSGTPLMSGLFEKAQAVASYDTVCYINADIMLLGDFMGGLQRVISWRDRFLMVGSRRDVELDDPAIYESADQEIRLQELVVRQNRWINPWAIDYFVFPRGLFPNFPPFAIGRPAWDNWFLWKACHSKAALVDASDVVFAVHQNHDYSHDPQGWQGVRQGEDAERNRKLANGNYCTVQDATHKLTVNGIEYNFWHLFVPTKRVVEPWWRALSKISAPIRHPLGLRRDRFERMLGRIRLLSSR
jgi:hypothetical protein